MATDRQAEYAAALAREGLVRDVACLGLPERIGVFSVRPMTLRHYVALRVVNSPFLPPRRMPNATDLAALLWLLAFEFQPGTGRAARRARKCFLRPLRDLMPPVPGWWIPGRRRRKAKQIRQLRRLRNLMRAAFEYVDETFIDAPPPAARESTITSPQYYCDAVGICSTLARAYGGGPDIYADMPLKLVFQLLKENREHMYISNGKPPVMYNQSDSVNEQELIELNRKLHRDGAPMHPAALELRERLLHDN